MRFIRHTSRNFTSEAAKLPLLLYVSGLDSKSMPEGQLRRLTPYYDVISLCHSPNDRSDWEQLVFHCLPHIRELRAACEDGILLLGESFGAALALRLVAAAPDAFRRLVLLNSGTALSQDKFLTRFTRLLPILKVDRSERVLYKLAAIFLFRVMLTSERVLDERSMVEEIPFLRSVDIDAVPLDAMLHRVRLLREFENSFTDECVKRLVDVPTVLMASERDALLQSTREMERLDGVLNQVEKCVLLEGSGHAALLERDVDLCKILREVETDGEIKVDRRGGDDVDAEYEDAYEEGRKFFEPWRQLISPRVLGKGHIFQAMEMSDSEKGEQRRPVLFVGNHGVFGILDTSVLYMEIKSIISPRRLRSLADPIHFELFSEISNGRWGRFITDLGALLATPRNFYRLLKEGENILLFPGGAREVCRRRGEDNRLFWKSDVDFVRPAAKFNAIIVPFSAVGADDSVEILVDGQELQQVPVIGKRVKEFLDQRELSNENLMPIASFPPKTDRFYFRFHEPVDTMGIDHKDVNACRQGYVETKNAVERGMAELQRERDRDPDRRLGSRMRKGVEGGVAKSGGAASGLQALLGALLPDIEMG